MNIFLGILLLLTYYSIIKGFIYSYKNLKPHLFLFNYFLMCVITLISYLIKILFSKATENMIILNISTYILQVCIISFVLYLVFGLKKINKIIKQEI